MSLAKKNDWGDRRVSHRLQVALPLLVRGTDVHGVGFEDTSPSYDVSREGASFVTSRELQLGQPLELIIPHRPLGRDSGTRTDFETTGEVRRLKPTETGRWEVGIHFTGPRLRTYISETA